MKGREYQFLNPLMFWIFFCNFEYPLSKSCARPCGPGAHTIARRGLGVARTMAWCVRPLAPSVSALDSVSCREK
jgi:hypothetical protein